MYHCQDDDGCVVDTVVAGDLIGWSALVAPYSCTATAVPRVAGSAVRIDAAGIRKLCELDHTLGYQLLRAGRHAQSAVAGSPRSVGGR